MAIDPFASEQFTRLVAAFWDAAVFLGVLALVWIPGRYGLVAASERLLDRLGVDPTIELPFLKLLTAVVAVLAVFAASSASGLTGFLRTTEAIVAGATIALGFAAQDVLGNLVSGTFIVLDPEFNIGDEIAWDDRQGVIEDISFRVTRVHTYDNELISVPNSELTDRTVVNPSAKDRRRIVTAFGIGYDDDIDRARDLLLAEAAAHEEILDRPGATVMVSELADSYVGLEARFWITDPVRADVLRIESEYVQAVKERFDAEGIEMPYPYRQLTGELATRRVEDRDPGLGTDD